MSCSDFAGCGVPQVAGEQSSHPAPAHGVQGCIASKPNEAWSCKTWCCSGIPVTSPHVPCPHVLFFPSVSRLGRVKMKPSGNQLWAQRTKQPPGNAFELRGHGTQAQALLLLSQEACSWLHNRQWRLEQTDWQMSANTANGQKYKAKARR